MRGKWPTFGIVTTTKAQESMALGQIEEMWRELRRSASRPPAGRTSVFLPEKIYGAARDSHP